MMLALAKGVDIGCSGGGLNLIVISEARVRSPEVIDCLVFELPKT